MAITIKNWYRVYFNGKKALITIFSLLLILTGINVINLFRIGYVSLNNGTEEVICYAEYDYDFTFFNITGQIHLYIYSIVSFAVLTIVDLLIIYKVVFASSRIKNDSGHAKKMEMVRTILILNFSFIVLTLPSAVVSGFFYVDLSQSQVGIFVLNLCDNISFSYHSFNIITLYLTNKRFKNEIKSIFNFEKIKKTIQPVSNTNYTDYKH